MPISGRKEIGPTTTLAGGQSSNDFLMGVPIKKRKFPYTRPSSPPPVSEPKPDPSPSITPTSPQDATQHSSHIVDETNAHPSQLVAPSSTSQFNHTSSLVDTTTALQTRVTCAQLQMETLEQKLDGNIGIQNQLFKNDKPNLTDNSLQGQVLLPPPHPELPLQDSEWICQEDQLHPCSWNLALTESQTSPSSSNNADSKVNCTRLHANRTNWDLNTMMDMWEGPTGHSAVVDKLGLDEKCDREQSTCSNKTIICQAEGSVGASGKKMLEQSEDNSKMSTPLDPQTKGDVLLHLSLSTSPGLQSGITLDRSHTVSPKVDSGSNPSNNVNLSKNMLSSPNNLLDGSRVVKSEPFDGSSNPDFKGVKESSFKLVKGSIVKTEPSIGFSQEHLKSSNIDNLKLTTHELVKLEPICGTDPGNLRMSEEKSTKAELSPCKSTVPSSSQLLPLSEVPNHEMTLPTTMHPLSCPTSLGLSSSTGPIHSETPTIATIMLTAGHTAHETTDCTDVKMPEVASNMQGSPNVSVVGPSIRISMDKLQSDSRGNKNVAESDEEKINIFDDMQDDCSSDIDDEPDVNHCVGTVLDSEDTHHGAEDDDYEDGEVREPLVHFAIEVGVGSDKEIEHAYRGISDSRDVSISGSSDRIITNSAHVDDRDVPLEDSGVTKIYYGSGEYDAVKYSNRNDSFISEPSCLQEPPVGVLTVGNGRMELIKAAHRGLLNCNGKGECLEGFEKDLLFDGTDGASQGITPGEDQGSTLNQQENVKEAKSEETTFSVWSKTEPLVIGAEATDDVNGKCNQSRIINLARAFSGGPSPGRMRSFPGRFLPSRIERERFNDGVRNGDKLYPHGNRDDGPMDGRNKFERQRSHGHPVVSGGSDFMHGRGRPDKRFGSPHGMVARDGAVLGTGRKPLRDDFRHPPRRRSPVGRGRPISHGVQIVRRSARDITPDRCIGRSDPNLIGLRPEKKFMRNLPDDMMDTVFSRSQPQYQQLDDHFVRRERNFSPIQRKGPLHIPRIRSRSSSRTRSPGPWSSPRRRSPDGFGRPELIHRRSPPFYRMKRMRSPHQRPVFTDDIDGRRHVSPPYISRASNDMREMSGAPREPDHPRSFISNRSPSGRVYARGSRRFDMMDPRERVENDKYFAGPMRPDIFHEIGVDGGNAGRRICAERRRSFRSTYDATEAEKFQFHVEGGTRSYRFSPEADSEFQERGNLRDREFERRAKNRSGNASRRTRSVEDQEENYRHNEQGWDDTGFEDVSPAKRRRF